MKGHVSNYLHRIRAYEILESALLYVLQNDPQNEQALRILDGRLRDVLLEVPLSWLERETNI